MTDATEINGKILHGIGTLGERLEAVSADEVRWDGSAESTTHKVRLSGASATMGHDVYAHLEVEVTGRKRREQTVTAGRGARYSVDGVKVRFRFTGVDSSGEWHDGVLC